jgi:hypothetical protein
MLIEDGVEQVVEQPDKPAKPGKEPETVTLTKAEVETLRRERDEARESERTWYERATGRGAQADPAEPEEEDEPEPEPEPEPDIDPEKFVDELAKDGLRALKRHGVMTRSDVEKLATELAEKVAGKVMDRRFAGMQSSSKLVTDFPDLNDENSELMKASRPIYRQLFDMNGKKHSTALMYAAAKAAKTQLDAKAPPPRTRRDEDDYDRYEPEEDRRARARAQGSERGRPAPVHDDDSGDLGPEALEICRAMNVTPEEYVASQKQLGARRRR